MIYYEKKIEHIAGGFIGLGGQKSHSEIIFKQN